MKPCAKNRKPIAWLALGALDGQKAAALRDHLACCEGCRRYWEETANVTEGLASAASDSKIQASEFFNRRVAEKLKAVESSFSPWFGRWMPNWRVAVPAFAVIVIALFALVAPRRQPALPTVQSVPASSSGSDLAPTIANYQMMAGQSLEKLSELLTRQGNKSLPPAPVYTISGLELANASMEKGRPDW